MAWIIGLLVIIALLFVFPKYAGIGILFLIVAVIGIVLNFRNDAQRSAQERGQVTINASLDADACTDPTRPLLVAIQNAADRTVIGADFTIRGHLAGFSTTRYTSSYSSDVIIRPDETSTGCWGLDSYSLGNDNPDDLSWTASITSVAFAE